MVKDPENTIWMGMEYFVTEGDELWEENDEKFISNAIDELVKLKIVDRADVIDAVRIKVKKAYPAYFDSYKNIDQVINYLNKFSNLYCIGRNGQHRYNNMDHSMLTAIEAVKVFIDPNNNSKDIIWKVNTEQEYHESKDSKQ